MPDYILSGNTADAIVELVAADVLPALMNQVVFSNLVSRDFQNEVNGTGDTVNVPVAPNLKSNNILETGQVVPQNPSLGNVQVQLHTHAESTFVIGDIARVLTGQVNLRAVYLDSAAKALAERMENDIALRYSDFNITPAVGSGATDITENVLSQADTALFRAKLGMNVPRHLVVTPEQYSELGQIPRFTEVATSGNPAAIASGAVGKLKNFNIYRSVFVPNVAGTNFNLAFASEALIMATRLLPLPEDGTGTRGTYAIAPEVGFAVRVLMSYNAQSLGHQFTIDCLYGVSSLRTQFGLQVLSR